MQNRLFFKVNITHTVANTDLQNAFSSPSVPKKKQTTTIRLPPEQTVHTGEGRKENLSYFLSQVYICKNKAQLSFQLKIAQEILGGKCTDRSDN